MDKLHRLKMFKKAAGTALGRDAVRLYLLLLAACDDNGYGEIAVATVRAAVDKRLDAPAVRKMIDELSALKLVQASVREGGNEGDGMVIYHLQSEERENQYDP